MPGLVPRLDREARMSQLREFVSNTALDLRGGRQSWRVLSMLWTGSLALSVALTLALR